MNENLSRRQLLVASLVGATGFVVGPSALFGADATPAQVDGPFHPLRTVGGSTVDLRVLKTLDKNTDLTFVDGRGEKARGRVLYVAGVVRDEAGKALTGATVEIWQACYSGKYNHRSDTSSNPIDANFQYWGFATTDAAGHYGFKTILPGAYRNDPTWIRPPHIHVKVRKAGIKELTTQLYFKDTSFELEGKTYSATTLRRLNTLDLVLSNVPVAERARVIAPLELATPGLDANSRLCTFDIVVPS